MNRLKELRKVQKQTQQQLSNELRKEGIKLSVAAISKYERERLMLSTKMISELARYFNVSIGYLTGRSNNRKPSLIDNIVLDKTRNVNNIRIERERKHLSQAELGKKVGVTREYISEYELGIRPVPVELWDALSEAFNDDNERVKMDISYLLGINGKYIPHSMDNFVKGMEDHNLLQSINETLSLLDWAYKNTTFSKLYLLLAFYEQTYQEEVKTTVNKIQTNSVYMFESIIDNALRMLLEGDGKNSQLDQEYFLKLFSVIEDYDYEKFNH